MNRTMRWAAMGFLFFLGWGVPGAQAQQPVAAEPQAPSGASPAGREVVRALPVPRLVKFAGVFKDEQGRPRSGVVGVTFAIYKEQEAGAALWLETQNVELDEQGGYTVLLGATKSEGLPLELFSSGEPRWLGVHVNLPREAELPRVLLVSVPYALKAADAETLGGKPASAFLTTESLPGAGASASPASPGALPKSGTAGVSKNAATTQAACASVTSDGTATMNSIGMFTTACNIQSSVLTQSGTNVGIGTAAPAVAMDIVGNNAGLRLSGTGTHQVTVTGASSGRLGQDANGFFFTSDTNGKSVRFLTNNGTLNEWMRITSAGNVGIGTTVPTAPLEVAGNLKVSGAGHAIIFSDGTIQTSSNRTRGITFVAGCDTCALLADTDSEKTIYVNVIGAMTFQSVTCYSDAGNPIINIRRDTGVAANILASNLTCSPVGATSTSFVTGQNILNVNEAVDFAMVTAGGQAHRVTVVVKATLN